MQFDKKKSHPNYFSSWQQHVNTYVEWSLASEWERDIVLLVLQTGTSC